ncbi:MAG: hypothetical protein K2L82_14705 [Lachnospiraceae bacterium]|nr:hypothetical protein [Lachnospiraceae bacterium]
MYAYTVFICVFSTLYIYKQAIRILSAAFICAGFNPSFPLLLLKAPSLHTQGITCRLSP